MLSEMMQTEMD